MLMIVVKSAKCFKKAQVHNSSLDALGKFCNQAN